MRLLLGNPNTSPAVTEAIAAAARAVASPGVEIKAVTATFGARIIGTRTEMAIAEHASVALMAAEAAGCDAAIIGASLDSGLGAVREMLAIPVLGITEAALHVACLCGGRFGLVVMSARSGAVTREMVAAYGLAGRLAGLAVVTAEPGAVVADPQALAGAVAAAANRLVESDGADVVVLVGAAMAAMPARVQAAVAVPVIEGVSCAVTLAEALVRLRLPKPRAGSYAALPARELLGVSPAITALFG